MKYYLIRNDVQLGPLDEAELLKLGVRADEPVWCEGMTDWQPAGQVSALAWLFSRHGAPHPPYNVSATQHTYAPGGDRWDNIPDCPPNYLAWCILATLFCCLPLGVVAIVKSCSVNSAYNRGDYAKAMEESRSTKNWLIASVVVSLVSSVGYVIFWLLSVPFML